MGKSTWERGGDTPVGAEVIPEIMDYREEITGIGGVEGESIAVGSRREYESKMADSLLDKQSSRIVGELEEKGSLPLNESGGLGISPLKHEEVGVFEKPGFINADRINGSFPEQESPGKVLEQSNENQTVDEIDGTGENEQGTFPEPSGVTSCLKEERNTESIESCPPIPELRHHLPNETGEPSIEGGKITENPVPEVLPGREIETEDVNENAPVGVVEPNIEHETVIREKDDSTDAEEPEIITYRGRDLVEEGYRGNPPRVELENENVLQTEELKGKGHSVFVEESGGVEGDGLEKAIPSDGQFTENYNIAEKKGEEIGIFSSNEDARKPVTEGGDEADGQIEGTVESQVSEASVPEEKVDVEVPNEKVAPDIPNVKDNSVDGLPSAEVSALRNKILDEDEIPKTSDNDVDEIYFGDHKEEDVQEDDVIGNDGLSKDRELTTIETVTAETGLPAPGATSNRDSASHPENYSAEGGKNEGSGADSIGITREITDHVAIEGDDASLDSNVYTEAMDGYPGNDPISVPEVTRDEFPPDVAEKEAPSGANASNEFDIAGEEDTSSGLTLSGDHTEKEYEEVSSCASSGEVVQEKAVEVSTELADTVPGRDNDAEAHSAKDDDTSTRNENETLESTDRDAETDDARDPIETSVPIVADSLGDFVQQETRVIPPEQESLTETSARPLENFADERNVSEEALSMLEDQPLDVPCTSSEVKHMSEESNISEEVHLHAGLPVLTKAATEVSETQTANVPEALTEEKLDVDQRSAELDTEILSVVPVDSNIDNQLASNEASNYEEDSAAEAVVTESKIPDEKISKKSFEQLKQDADEIDEDGKPSVTEGESERELDKVPDQEVVLDYTNTSAGNVLNNTFKKSETDMNTEQPHDMADQGDITQIEVPKEQIEEAPLDTTIPLIDLKDSHSDDQLAFNEEPKYEESSAAEVVTNRQILEEKILASSFDGEFEAQIGQDTDEVEKHEETAPGKGKSAGEHVEVLAREEVPSVLHETTVDGMQQQDIANQIDIPLTETTVETTEKATVYDSAIDTSTDNQRDVSHFGTPTQDQELQTNQKRDEPTNDDATSTLQDDTKIDRQTEETHDITLRETTDEVASKIQEDDSFGVAGEVSENPIDGQSASYEDLNYEEASVAEAVVTKSKIPEETSTEEQLRQDKVEIDRARELNEVLNGAEVPEATNTSSRNTPNEKFEQIKTEVSDKQPHDMADQGDIAPKEVPREPIIQDGVDTTIPLVDQKDGHGNDQLASNKDPKSEESSVAEAATESEILEEKILTRSFGDSLEAQIGQDADEAEKYEGTVVGEGNSAKEHDEVPAREEVPLVLDETIVDGVQQQGITDQTDIELTEATVETTEKTVVYDSATDASIDDQIDASHYGTPTQDQTLENNQKRDEPTNDDDASTCQDVSKIDTQTEETTDITLRETTDEVVSKIQEDGGFGVASEVLENPIDVQSSSNEDSNYEEASAAEALVFESKIPEEIAIEEQLRQDTVEINSARELDEVPNREEVLEATNASSGNVPNENFEQLEMEVSGKQPHDLADQGDIARTKVPGEPIEQDGVDTTIPLVDQKDGCGDDQLASIGDPKYEENSAAEVVTEGKILEEKILTRIPDDSLEAQIGQDADETEKYEETVVGEGNSAREHNEVPAREEVPPDLDETVVDGVQQQDITDQTDITLTEATMETTGKTAVYDSVIDASTDNQRDLSHFGTPTQDQALKTNQNRDEQTNDDDASVCQDVPKINTQTEETTDITLRETTDEVVSKIQEDDSFGVASEVLENPIDGQSASNDESNYEEASAAEAMVFESKIPEEIAIEEQLRPDTVEIDDAPELDEVPNREEVLEATNTSAGNPPNEKFKQLETEVSGKQPHDMADQGDIALTEVPGEPIERDGVYTKIPLVDQKDGRGDDQFFKLVRNITDQTDIALAEATVETTEKAAVYDSATDTSIDDQIDASHFGTLKQDQELKTNKKQDETIDDNAASTCRDYAEIDTPTEETLDITLSETTDEVVSKIQEDDSFGLASEVLENPIEESAISPDETIKSEPLQETSGERQVVEEPALGQGEEGSSLVDDNINKNERGTVGSSEFMDAADSIKEIKEDGLQTEDVNEPLTGTGITEDKDPNDIIEKDLIYGTESDEKIDAGEVASETKDISLREVEQYEQHNGESTSLLQVGFSETPESEPSLDQTVVVDQTDEEIKEIYDSNDRDGEIAYPDIHQSSVNEASDEQTEEETAAVEVDSNIVSGTETGITDTEPSQISRDVDTKSFEERNSATENTENKESFYEEGKYNIESKDRPKEVTRSEELVEAKETSNETVFSHSELVESTVAEEDILDQGIGMENSYEQDSSLVPPEENEVKDQDVPSCAATDSFSEKKEQDKEAKEPYEEISHPQQKDLVDITEADYDKGTSCFIPADTQELITFEGDIQKDEACIKNKMEASENEGEDDQPDAQGILAEEVALEGEIASKDIETDRIVQEAEKGNKEAKNSREANEDRINKDGEVDMGSSTIDEELLANTTPATETVDLENKNSYTTADNSHVEVIESEKRDLTLSNEIVEEGDSYTVSADTPFSERSISDNQPGMSSENFDSENAGELNSTAESVEDVAGKEEAPVDSEGHVVETTGQRELIIATEISDEAALSDTQNETAITLQTQPRDHSYEQDSVESAPAEGSTIEFNGENEQDRQDKTSDEQSSRVEIDNPEAEVEGIESNEVLQNEAETTEGGSAEEAPQLAHYTEISLDGPSDEMSAFSTSVPDDVQEREIREIVASKDDQTSRTIQEVSEHTNVDGVASADAEAGLVKTTPPTQSTGNLEEESIGETTATITPDENDDSKEESFVVENQITSEQILEPTDQQIEPIPSGEALQEESEVVESASIGKSTLDENPLLHVSKKESSKGIQSCATNDAWPDGKEPTLQTDISQDESVTRIPMYADKERDVTETEEITPLDLGDRGFTSAVQTKEISTEEDASKIKEVVSEDADESISDAIREVIPVTTDTQPSMSSEYLDGENSGELNPTAVSVENGASEEEGTDAGIEEASEALVDSKGHEEEATGQSELINATEVSAEAALSDVPDETTSTIKTVPADYLYERDFVELTEESKVHVESADGSTIECYGNTEQDIEDKTSNEQTSQVEIDNRDLAADMLPRYVLATAENVEIDRAAFDERTTRPSDICEQKSALVEEVERNRGLELSTLEEAFIQTDREDISFLPEAEVGGSETNEVLQKEAETKEGGSVEEAPQFAHSMVISLDGPSDQIPILRTSVPYNVQEIRTPEIVTSEDDQTNRTIPKALDDDSRNKVVHTQEYTSNEERPANGIFVEETIASDQLTQEQESSNSRSGENIGEVIKDVHTDGGVAAAGIVKPTEPTEITGNLENESIGETGENVMPNETDVSKEEGFVEPFPHEEAVITEIKDVEPVFVGESTIDQSPLADVSREVSTLLHARTEAWSDGNEPTLQTDVCQDESDTSMSKFADKEIDVQETEKSTPIELGNRDFTSAVQTKVVFTEEDTSKIKEVVSKGVGESVDVAIGEVNPVTSDTQPSMSSEYLDRENGGELSSASVSVEDVAGKEEGTDASIEETSEALIDSKGHEVEAMGQRYLINTMEVSDEAALSDASNETAATIQIVPTMAGSTIEFDGENEQEVQDKTFNEKASQDEIDNQDLAAYGQTRDVPATVENVEIDQAELDEQTDEIDRSLPPEAETGGNERNQVLQNESETKEKFSGEEALQSTEISLDGPSDQMSAFRPDAVQEREIREIVASEDELTNRTIQEELDDESGNKVEQGDNAEKAEQEFSLNEERLASGESFEETISSDQLTQSTEQESNGSLGDENVSKVIKCVYTDIGGVSSADAEADITNSTRPTHSTVNLEEESIGAMSTAVSPDENLLVPREEAVLAETEDVEQASVGESTFEQNPLADESTLLHARTEVWPDGNEPTLQTDVSQDESDSSMPKYAEKERNAQANGKIAPPELGDRDFSSAVPTKDILTEEDASKTDEVASVDIAADDTKEQPSVTTEDTILKNKEVRDDTGHAAGKPEDMIEIYGDKTSVAASVVDAETTIPRENEETAEVGESVHDAIVEVVPMTSDSSSPVPKEEEMLATETEHEKENASLEINQRNLKDTADLKYVNIDEMAADIPSPDGLASTGSVSYLPQGSIDTITAASVDQESASLTLPSEETVVDKAWTSRKSPDAEHFEVGFKETSTEDDTAEKYGESRSLDFTNAQADQETKNEINGGEILSGGDSADKADYGLASEAVEIADKVDPSLKEKKERYFDEAQIFEEMASQEQDEYKQGATDEDKADANDPVEGTVDRAPLEEAEGHTFDSVEGMVTDRKMETPVPNVQGSSEEIFEGDRAPAIEDSKELNQVISSKEDAPTAYHDSGLPRDASLAKEAMVNLPGSTERGLPPAEAREFRDPSEVNLDSKEFEGGKFSDDTTTVPQTPVADNLQLPEQSAIIKPDENEEHEDDDHEHIEHSKAAHLMEESPKDIVDGKARQKKSHNHLFSGMSSKVKSSISKVKKVITGKSSNHNKEHSPKHGQ